MHGFKFLSALLSVAVTAGGAWAADTLTESTMPNAAPCMSWKNPMVRPRFAMLCIHGLGLYSKSYEDFAQRIALQGGVVYAIDVRGFGSWMKSEGHEKVDFNACLNDIQTALQSIRQANPTLPVFLLGESMGGAIALRAASMYPELMDGVISSVPAEERFKTKKTDLKIAMEMLRGPNRDFNIGKQIVEQAATAERIEDGKKVKVVNEQLAQDWGSDPLDRMNLSAKELLQFQAFMNDNHDAVKKITSLPVLFVQGLDDRLVKPEGTWELVQAIRTPDRMMMALPSRHLVFEETQTADPKLNRASTQLVLGWIAAHIASKDEGDAPGVNTKWLLTNASPTPEITGGKPTILAFYADWAEQCSDVDLIVDRCSKSGDRVKCVKIDVNDQSNQNLLKLYNVGAVPTLVFLNSNGSVSSTVIGETKLANIAKSIMQIVRPAQLPNRPNPLARPGMKRRAQFRAIGK